MVVVLKRKLPDSETEFAVNPECVQWVQPYGEKVCTLRMYDGFDVTILQPFDQVVRMLND
jgi:hypothetical protein